MKPLIYLWIFLLPVAGHSQPQQQLPFSSDPVIWMLTDDQSISSVWIGPGIRFTSMVLFLNPDSSVSKEWMVRKETDNLRFRDQLSWQEYRSLVAQTDSLLLLTASQSGPVAQESRSDLKFDFTLGHVGYVSSFHAWAVPYGVLDADNPGLYFLLSGGSYFLVNQTAKDSRLTRANVSGSIEGHLSGIAQGLMTGVAADNMDAALTLGSAGGILHGFYSFQRFSQPEIRPLTEFLTIKTELYSLFWPLTFGRVFSADNQSSMQILAGVGVATSLSARWWAPDLFGFDRYSLSLPDAMLVEDFHLASVLTVMGIHSAVGSTDQRILAGTLGTASVLGFYGGILNNRNQNFTAGEVRLAKRFIYGGMLLGLGAFMLIEEPKAVGICLAGGTWAGYFAGKRIAHDEETAQTGPDIRIFPENFLVAGMMRKNRNPETMVQLPVVSVNWML